MTYDAASNATAAAASAGVPGRPTGLALSLDPFVRFIRHVRTDAERAAGQRRLEDEIRAWRLAEVRRSRSLTQREVAEAMGVSGPRVSDVERGKLDTVFISVLRAYVEALGGRLQVTAEFDDSAYTFYAST